MPNGIHNLKQINYYVSLLCCYFAEQINAHPKHRGWRRLGLSCL